MQDTDASEWTFSDDLVPSMKARAERRQRAVVETGAGEEGPIPPMHAGGLAGFLGLTFSEMLHNAPVAVDFSGAPESRRAAATAYAAPHTGVCAARPLPYLTRRCQAALSLCISCATPDAMHSRAACAPAA